jgi:hypothetical protein
VNGAVYTFRSVEFASSSTPMIFTSAVTLRSCRIKTNRLSFRGDLTISFDTFETIVSADFFEKVTGLSIIECSHELRTVRYEADRIVVVSEGVVTLPADVKRIRFDLARGHLVVDSTPWSELHSQKYGLIFTGQGVIEFSHRYNISVPE